MKILTEFLCEGRWDIATAWAETEEKAKQYCEFNGIKLLKWGLRTVQIDDETKEGNKDENHVRTTF